MDGPPFQVPALLDNCQFINIQIDSGCDCYAAMSDQCAARLGVERIRLPRPRQLGTVLGRTPTTITHLAKCEMDLDGWKTPVLFYIIPGMPRSAILGLPWLKHRNVTVRAAEGQLTVESEGGMRIKELHQRTTSEKPAVVIGSIYAAACRRQRRNPQMGYEFVSTSLREMTRVLQLTATDPDREPTGTTLPPELAEFADLFDKTKASGLPPHRGNLDHHIQLKKDEQGRTPDLPWGRLYSMPRDQLLELRQQIVELMDKGWIRASSSPAAAPVLMVRKPGGGWRLCVDYRALNNITLQDRYPLPLIKETLRSLSGAKWLTKVDVRAAFHKIRVAEGDEHLTAFRTRFGLFEWLVCPFGLSGAPATFQRYINGILGDILDDFVSAYLDDILIYSSGSRRDHMNKVREVLNRLREAGLNLDLSKSAFAVKEVKYLGFVIKAGEGIQADPEKIQAIRNWEAPKRLRGLRGFLGFANFYRDFIDKFSELAEPLVALTKKGVPYIWSDEVDEAFEKLKLAFIQAPVLAQWEPDRETKVETDCSGSALGGCLSQRGKDGLWRPVAYHSAKLKDAERNYTIHDKELLAVVECLKAWKAELRGVKAPFLILTDHKALEYFSKPREVSERQMRWAETLAEYSYQLQYRPGKHAVLPDALSRREQDESKAQRSTTVLRPTPPTRARATITLQTTSTEEPDLLPQGNHLFQEQNLSELWDEGLRHDTSYKHRLDAVKEDARRFPPEAETKAQVADCGINAQGALQFKGRLWLPAWEPLTTAVLQKTHASPIVGHAGRDSTFRILQRSYHWDGMAQDCARFVRNCDICRKSRPSRQLRQGLLQPLPIPERFWSDISIDFMTDLPSHEEGGPRYLMVITDRLSKYVQLEAMESMKSQTCAARFKEVWWRFRGFPNAIISDRGSDWVGDFWSELCRLVGIKQLLSTSYHPQTDGGTERMNQEVQQYMRCYLTFAQEDWPEHLAACQLTINNRDSTVTGFSPNRLLLGFDVDPIPRTEPFPSVPPTSEKGRAVAFLTRLEEGTALAGAASAYIQQRQESDANRKRRPAEQFKVGDEVWLSLRNIKTDRPSKKLDWLHNKYKVTAVPSPLTVTLDVPQGIHPTFHVELIERAADDPLPSQTSTDTRPGPVLVPSGEDGEEQEEFVVEEILAAKNARGRGKKRQVLVKWKGYDNPDWQPLEQFEDTEALDRFEAKWGDARSNNGPESLGKRRARERKAAREVKKDN
jgi:transposase InsO family protein